MATSPAKPKILPLTSARFFAALYVMLYHTLPRSSAQNPWQDWVKKFIGMGYISVSFFFMLSGFILAVVYLRENRPVNKRRFFVARFARIYPLYLVAMLLDTPHFLHIERAVMHRSLLQIAGEFLATAGLVQSWVNLRSLNPPGWSLSTETFFYITFPFLGVAFWKLRTRLALPVSILIYGAGIVLVLMIDHLRGTSEQSYNPVPHLFIFTLGILLAKGFVWIGQSPTRSQSLATGAPWMLLACLVGLLAIPLTSIVGYESQLQHGLLAPLFAVAILAFASGNRAISSLFSAKWMVVLGEASYALYLLHYPIHSLLRRQIEQLGTPMYLLYLLGAIGLSVVSYHWLEIPARRWILAKEHVRSMETEVTSALSQ
ncbi:MAG TPA: acyltransferase [Edaphobacter sp.]|jgi:peptidoglycan/LPS O-acetylase OafA/YrhL